MPSITVTFDFDLNELVQLGDVMYYINPSIETMQDSTEIPFNNQSIWLVFTVSEGEKFCHGYNISNLVPHIRMSIPQ